jgi:preprotein translocase subunit SecF
MGLWADLYHGRAHFNFVKTWRYTIIGSCLLVAIAIVSVVGFGLNRSIEFKGGTSWDVLAPDKSVADARDILRPLGEGEAKIQVVDGTILRIQSAVKDPQRAQEISTKLAELGEVEDFHSVGPSWGKEITKKSIRALVVFFVLLAAFMSWRLEWKMAFAAIVAMVHDILISIGVYAVLQIPVTPATVVSFLTILGYSMYDTVVVFDKALELSARPAVASRHTYSETMNMALNQVIMRSVNTTLMGVVPVAVMLIVGLIQGADTLLDFAVALLVGMIVGAYSSIYVAAPIVAWLKEREPRHRQVRARLGPRPDGMPKLAVEGGVAGAGTGGRATVPVGSGPAGSGSGEPGAIRPGVRRPGQGTTTIPPRPRKKKRR